MKILYTIDQVYKHGGIEKVLSQKANFFAEQLGYEVSIITHSQKGNLPVYWFSPKIKFFDLGIDYEDGVSFLKQRGISKILKHRSRLNNYIQNLKPDVVISASLWPDLYFLPGLQKKIPKIREFHSTRFFTHSRSLKDKVRNKISLWAERRYSAIVILNEDEKPYYDERNVVIIPNPTEIDERMCVLADKKIVAAGRICFQKNFEDLVEAFAIIAKEFSDWEVHIYGDDYEGRQEKIQKRIDELGLKHQIIFKGVTADLKTTFMDYSIYAMTSDHETFPMVLLEALSVGLPIVSYKCPTGPDRIVTDGVDGFITEYRNSITFADKLKVLITNHELRRIMGIKAKENASRFEISKVMQQWQVLFGNLTKR